MCASSAEPRQRPRLRRPGFTLIEALVALVVIAGAVAVVLPGLGSAVQARASREAGIAAALLAQSLLEAHAPPGAVREGRWQGRAPEGAWTVEVGRGEPGPDGTTLRPVRVALGPVTLDTLRPGPSGEAGPAR